MNGSLTLVLNGNNPRFPWKPSTTMLTYRLTGTTQAPASNRSEPPEYPRARARTPIFQTPRGAFRRRRPIADLLFYISSGGRI